MKSTVAKYNALLIVMILAVALASLAFNRQLIYEERLTQARQMLAGPVNHHVTQHLREAHRNGAVLSTERLADVIHESLHMPGIDAFGAVLDSQNHLVGGVGLTAAVRQAVVARPAAPGDYALLEEGDLVLLPIAVADGYHIVVGFSRDSIARSLWPITASTTLFVAAALALYFLLAFVALRHWIVNPLVRFLETRLRGSIDGIVSGNLPSSLPEEHFDVLPEEISVNIERNMRALDTWARHKTNFDKFIAVSTAENNKQQLAANLYTILRQELPLNNLTLLEINHSQNRLIPIYDACGTESAETLLDDPQRCFVYRSGSRLVQMPGETVCQHCSTGAGAGAVLICKPLVSAGKEMGVCKVTLDYAHLHGDLASAGYGNPVAVAEALLDTYVYLTALSLSNLTLLDSYKNQAITDGLTGLYNRRYMTEYMASLLSISKRGSKALALFMVDIDNFKRLNDEYGHNSGDQVLKVVARTMRRAIRECDIIARYGGEEFVVTLPETDSALASEVGERLREAVASIDWDSHGLGNIPQVTVSVGIAEFPLHGYSHYHLTNAADKALYVAKRSGKNRVVIHQPLPDDDGGQPLVAYSEAKIPA